MGCAGSHLIPGHNLLGIESLAGSVGLFTETDDHIAGAMRRPTGHETNIPDGMF